MRTLAILGLLMATLTTTYAETKTFAGNSNLTLPEGCVWGDHTLVQHASAAIVHSKTNLVAILTIQPAQKGFAVTDAMVRGIDKGATKSGDAKKLSGEITSHYGVPCYDQHLSLPKLKRDAITRFFVANGQMFSWQISGAAPLPKDGKAVEALFNAFAFTGTPSVPEPPDETSSFSYRMGRIAGTCILGILILVGGKRLFGRK